MKTLKEQKIPSSISLSKLLTEGMVQIKGVFCLKVWIKCVCLRPQRCGIEVDSPASDQTVILSQVYPHFWVVVLSRYSQVYNQGQSSQTQRHEK